MRNNNWKPEKVYEFSYFLTPKVKFRKPRWECVYGKNRGCAVAHRLKSDALKHCYVLNKVGAEGFLK